MIQVTSRHGAHSIRCPITLSTPLIIDQSSKGELTVSGSIGEEGPQSLTKTGDHTVVLGASNRYSGGTNIESGILSISEDANLGMPQGILNIGKEPFV